jgi:putative acetyltransferase
MLVRDERAGDREAVRRVNELAFGAKTEADLVEALHAARAVTLSLVAEDERGEVVGHILFSPVTIDGVEAAIGLAPMAVLPGQQRSGIGTALVRAGLERLERAGHRAVVVLGHPAYYPRFGFVPASRFGLVWRRGVDDEAFMALELVRGSLPPGAVLYRPELEAL